MVYFSVKLETLTAFSSTGTNSTLTMNIGGSTQTRYPYLGGYGSSGSDITPSFVASVSSGSQSGASTNSANVSIQSGNAASSPPTLGISLLMSRTATQGLRHQYLCTTNTTALSLGNTSGASLLQLDLTLQSAR